MERLLHPLGLKLGSEAWARLRVYLEALEKRAPNLKLTAVKSRRKRLQTQVLESILLAHYLPAQGVAADLGTGAGIPGLVVKIIRPELTLVLIEAYPPRVAFMKEIIRKLSLSQVEALALHLGKDPWPGPFDVVFARGYGAVLKFTRHAAMCLKPKGKAFYLWRKDREPWGEGEPALTLLDKKTFPEINSPLLVWEKDPS